MDMDTEVVSNETIKLINETNLVKNVSINLVQLYDIPVSLIRLLASLYGVVSLLAVFGNLLVLWIVCSARRMQTATNYLIANLAVADIIMWAFTIPYQFQAPLLQRWVLPYFMCSFCPFVQVLSVNVSVSTLSVIALDRYRAVIYPLMARTTAVRAKVKISCIWMISGIFSMPSYIAWKVTVQEDNFAQNGTKLFCMNVGLSPENWNIYSHCLVFLQYIIPLCLINFTYVRMGWQLKKWKAPGNAETNRDVMVMKNKKKAIKMFCIVVIQFTVCWLPFHVYNAVQGIYPNINKFKYIYIIWLSCHLLAMSNCCFNPFMYAIFNDKFSREFLRICPCIFKKGQKSTLKVFGTKRSVNTRTKMARIAQTNITRMAQSNLLLTKF